jgi:hypothetical protein
MGFVRPPASLHQAASLRRLAPTAARAARRLREPAVAAVLIIALAAPADTLALASDRQIIYLEQGLTGTRNPQ